MTWRVFMLMTEILAPAEFMTMQIGGGVSPKAVVANRAKGVAMAMRRVIMRRV